MPRIFDNIELELLPTLRQTLQISEHADFCVGYFNLRGWKSIDGLIDNWSGGTDRQCRLLVGMQRLPQEDLREAYSLLPHEDQMSNQAVIRLKRRLAEEFRAQLTIGAPTDSDEAGLRRLSAQLKAGKVVVKLHLRHTLHAKLYLCFRPDPNNPVTGFVGSSNLTLSGLSKQGELNVDVLDHDATQKLARWFNDRWGDRWCVDITKELIQVIDESWARPDCPPPYQIYVKMAYHLAEEARAGLSEFTIPADMRGILLEFQSAAVRIAARHLEKRGGVILGDVVGLGKTLMATALARLFQDPPRSLETLILCPKNLVGMWEHYAHRYRLIAKVVSVTQAQNTLPDLRRYRVVIIDESHNLRNREGRRWAVIRDYIARNACKCILLSATPYNKAYLDLANQLRLFLDPEDVVGIRPEEYIRQDCNGRPDEFTRRHQCPLNCLSAFEKSEHPDDWREMMRLFMVRRTRSFVERNYAYTECPTCQTIVLATQADCPNCSRAKAKTDRRFLVLEGGTRFHFPKRLPKALHFRIRDNNPDDQYAKLYSPTVVDTVRLLHLPRYGLANYLKATFDVPLDADETEIVKDLSRAGTRLIGFCRINLFKRLESSGHSFLLSVRRHIMRNYIYLHALEKGMPLPIGTQDSSLFDALAHDGDTDKDGNKKQNTEITAQSIDDFEKAAAGGYVLLKTKHGSEFEWLRSDLFKDTLAAELTQDAARLFTILKLAGDWRPEKDEKLAELLKLLTKKHPNEKVLLFSQFADTIDYLNEQLQARGLKKFAAVTGDTDDPAAFACRFSPESNKVRDQVSAADELRVIIATDVLSEGQNLQDAAVVVNFDLPWAIIRLIQRAGRVDRIGQKAEEILCYSFIPAEGVERVIRLRARVRQRLQENAEVVGTDETFFEDEKHDDFVLDLFTEKSGILDDPADDEVDLASLAYQVWKNACDSDPALKKTIPDMANVVYSTKGAGGAGVPHAECKAVNSGAGVSPAEGKAAGTAAPPGSGAGVSPAEEKAAGTAAPPGSGAGVSPAGGLAANSGAGGLAANSGAGVSPAASPIDIAEASEPFPGSGACLLSDQHHAMLVRDALSHFEGERYHLHAWCVMPNHVHAVVTPFGEHTLSSIMHSWKSFTAHAINKRRETSGEVWERESFDHLVRSEDALQQFVIYVENNPVAAGLCASPGDWPLSSGAGSPSGAGVPPAECKAVNCGADVPPAVLAAARTAAPLRAPQNLFHPPVHIDYSRIRARGELPHLHHQGGTYFVTFCLRDVCRRAGSPPAQPTAAATSGAGVPPAEGKAAGTAAPRPSERMAAGTAAPRAQAARRSGVMVYVRTADGNDALAWVDEQGRTVTESQHEILRAAACDPATPALPRLSGHHTLVQQAVAGIQTEHVSSGGQLGKPASARRRVYERLKDYASLVKDSLFDIKPLHQAIDAIYDSPLTEAARDLLNREMKTGIDNEKLAELVFSLHEEDRLCVPHDDVEAREPRIICSLGIRKD